MTYCIGIKLNQGLVLLADTRTNAGVDNISKVKKLFTWQLPGDRIIAMMTAGNLAITQAVISEINERLDAPNVNEPTIYSAPTMFEVAQVVGDTMRKVQSRYGAGLAARNVDSGASILVAGQRIGGVPRLYMVYAAGNFIEATDDSPYFQLGEHKYGKPILDRVISSDTDLQDGVICALLSMDSTLKSNLTVGMPLDLAVIRTDTLQIEQQRRIEADDPKFFAFSDAWSNALRDAFSRMRVMDV
ncbi:MAG: peptidase [Ponticaulis sp.]|nr:peptidase [Ponticaulis sp.]|tara:strand:+ start:33711 stop:34442 length:732 start_codon:yes stop_codon:yes gene_type:complete